MTYARWDGRATGNPLVAIVVNAVRQAYDHPWGRLAFIGVFAYGVLYLGSVYSVDSGGSAHTLANFLDFSNNLRWGVLAIAAIMAGPALLEDAQSGALDLYRSRPVSRAAYLGGKSLAVAGAVFAAYVIPVWLYMAGTWFVFDDHPAGWSTAPFKALIMGLLWAIPISGAAIALSTVARSSLAAGAILFGGIATLDIFVGQLLSAITGTTALNVLSPLAAHAEQATWLYGAPRGDVDANWGLVALVVLAAVSWLAVMIRQPWRSEE